MKKNLLKILATMAIVVTLGACGKKPSGPTSESSESQAEQVTTLTLDALQLIDDEADENGYYPFTNNGKLVKVEDLCLAEKLDASTYIVNWNGDTVGSGSMGGVIVELAQPWADADLTRKENHGAKVAVQGRATDEGGKIVLKDAEFVSVERRVYPEGSSTRQEGTGAGRYYTPGQYVDRGRFSLYGARSNYGVEFGGFTAQFVSEAVTAEGGMIKYVLPGENLNNSAIELYAKLPALTENQLAGIKSLQKGDFIELDGFSEYDNRVAGCHKGVVLGEWYGDMSAVDDEDAPEIFASWAKAINQFDEEFRFGLPAVGTIDGISSYLVDDTYLLDGPSEYFTAAALAKLSLTNKDKAGMVIATANLDDEDVAEDAIEDFADAFKAAGFTALEVGGELAANDYGYAVFTAKQDTTSPEHADDVTTEIWLGLTSETSMEFLIMSELMPVTDTVEDLLLGVYLAGGSALLEGYAFSNAWGDPYTVYNYSTNAAYAQYADGGVAIGQNHFYSFDWDDNDEVELLALTSLDPNLQYGLPYFGYVSPLYTAATIYN